MGAFGVVADVRNGMPKRFRGEVRTLVDGAVDIWNRRNECARSICRVGSADASESFILWGDSHAGALAPALEQAALAHNASGFIAFHPACAPLLRLKRYDQTFENCSAFSDSVLDHIRTHPVRTVILHARWAIYSEGQRYKQEPGDDRQQSRRRRRTADQRRLTECLVRVVMEWLAPEQLGERGAPCTVQRLGLRP